jgi:mono/diheme cytochrome c family protein
MRRLLGLALLVPLVAGCGWFGGWSRHPGRSRYTATVGLYPTAPAYDVPRWVKAEHLPKKAIRGAVIFAGSGCTACHTYAGSGGSNLNAPDLTSIGRRHLGIRFEINHLKCPACVNPGSPMPSFRGLGAKRLHQLAVFLEASKGIS